MKQKEKKSNNTKLQYLWAALCKHKNQNAENGW